VYIVIVTQEKLSMCFSHWNHAWKTLRNYHFTRKIIKSIAVKTYEEHGTKQREHYQKNMERLNAGGKKRYLN